MPPDDEASRARAEQTVNNAHQGDNDARQSRNDKAQQAKTNRDQGDTNTAQGVTNDAQGVTNTAQEATNIEQSDVNAAIKEAIGVLAKSVDANTASMEAVSKALEENLRLYTKIDVRLTEAEQKTLAVEAKSDKRASTYRRLWGMLAVTVMVVGVGGFGLNAYRTKQLCMQRNEANASSTLLVQEDVDMLLAKDPTNPALPGLQRYLTRSIQVDCGGFL